MSAKIELVDLTNLPSGETFLSEREQAFFQTLQLSKRRKEWLGGRFALKTLVHAETGAPATEIEVLPQKNSGKPLLYVRGKISTLPFSITHSNGYAAAAITTDAWYIGIDLEKVTHRMDSWKKDFFHPSELVAQDDAFLTSLWTQKEAVAKLLGTGLTIGSFDVRCVEGEVQFFNRALEIYKQLGSPDITLQTPSLIDEFEFSVATGK
ncbi:MAG: 4'-phosphopantetheinyl transferase superfamily protein [Elusimicrobiaceae bacterium]|nr:4'-phosphopantetheinyl transferase superfamily protein [Elusimicrobiaceae bacterium]